MNEPIVVVGIGADGIPGLSAESRQELQRATVVYGSPRQLALLDDTVTANRHTWPSPMLPAVERLLDDAPPAGAIHVVASGDPLLHGIGGTLIRVHGAHQVRVLPHVSSVTLACARMGWNAHDTEVISLVTAPVHTAVRSGAAPSCSAGTPPPRRNWRPSWPKPAVVHRNSPPWNSSADLGSGFGRPVPRNGPRRRRPSMH